MTSDGNVVTCSESDNSDLFYAVPWSYGTLGFLTAAKIRIIPAKRFIKMEYIPVHSFKEAVQVRIIAFFFSLLKNLEEHHFDFDRFQMMKDEIGKDAKNGLPAEFIECLAFSPSACVVMKGEMVDSCEPQRLNSIGTWHKPWFFKHVESFLDRGKTIEYIPLREYYHRHSRSIFWEIQDIIPFGNNVVFRYLLGWLIPPKVSLLKLTQGETIKKLYEENHMIQVRLITRAPLQTKYSNIIYSVGSVISRICSCLSTRPQEPWSSLTRVWPFIRFGFVPSGCQTNLDS